MKPKLGNVRFSQINNRKKLESMDMIDLEYRGQKPFIVFGTEPHAYLNSITGLNRRQNLIYAYRPAKDGNKVGDWPRSYIYASKSLDIWPVPKLCSQDVTTAIFDPHDQDKGRFLLCSLYWDGNLRELPQEFNDAVKMADEEGYTLLTCADTNAHSPLWGDKKYDHRAKKLELFMLLNNLDVANKGNKPTLVRKDCESCIDLTITSCDFMEHIKNWQVSDKPTHSDHRLITFEVNTTVPKTEYKLDTINANFEKLTELTERLGEKLAMETPESWTVSDIEQHTNKLTQGITDAIKECCTMRKVETPNKPDAWRIEEVKLQLRKVRRALHRWQEKRSPQTHLNWVREEKALTAISRREKRKAKQAYAAQVATPRAMAQLTKAMANSPKHEIGLLRNGHGILASSPEEALNILCDTHFYKSNTTSDPVEEAEVQAAHRRLGSFELSQNPWITRDRIKKALELFKNGKAPGPDSLDTKPLKYMGPSLYDHLGVIYNAVITSGYTPLIWRKSKVIFIPKMGKDDYSEPKAFRPISLTPFLFKTLERLCYWEIQETALADRPISKMQHAFLTGKSTETAISQTVNMIERSFRKRKFALAVFIDIAAAFDRLAPDAAIKAMRDRGINNSIINWYGYYLKTRVASITLKGLEVNRRLTLGCPQGGVLSVLIWILAFDDLLNIFEEEVKCVGYADDGCLIIEGSNLEYMYRKMNEGIKLAENWAAGCGLSISAQKTVAMLFTQKHKKSYSLPRTPLSLGGKTLSLEKETKYLGVTIDHKLTWSSHINNKLNQARKVLFLIKSTAGKLWGPNPAIMHWAYTSMVLPILSYCLYIFAQAITKCQLKKFRKLQRLALLMLGHMRRGTPTEGLNIITNTLPVELYIEKELLAATYRLRSKVDRTWDGLSEGKAKGHIKFAEDMYASANLEINKPNDCINKQIVWNRRFEVDTESFKSGNDHTEGVRCYTDGSKIDGHTGLGICLSYVFYRHAPEVVYCSRLADDNTVFQAEMKALAEAPEKIEKYLREDMDGAHSSVTILSDSQAAIKALIAPHVKCKTTQTAIDNLNKLGETVDITIKWIKAHVNYRGNEIADTQAKAGAALGAIDAAVPVSTCHIKQEIKEYITAKWNNKWKRLNQCRQTKIFFPEVNPGKSKKLLALDRGLFSTCVQWLTGHTFLNRHEYVIGNIDFNECRYCFLEEETSSHLITDCEVLWRERADCFQAYFLDVNRPTWSVDNLVKFLGKPSVISLDNGIYPS